MVLRSAIALTALAISVTAIVDHAGAQYVPMYGHPPRPYAAIPYGQVPGPAEPYPNYGSFRPEDQSETDTKVLPPEFKRQLVNYQTIEPTGTIIIDTPHTYLYLILGRGRALRYGVGVGREGFTWAGTQRIARMVEWPDWHPPTEMIDRQPARALYLGNTLYRIHGTNQPSTIGQFVSSGCIRLLNEDIEDLYSRVTLGTRVVVLPAVNPIRSQSTMQ
jgi:lipoprotein-anchoring transpeptidase ErfK/SrfK